LEVLFDAVKLRDETKRFFTWLREAGFDLDKLSSSVRPAVRELEVLTPLLLCLVRAVAVAHHDVRKVLEHLLGRIGTAAWMKLVHNRTMIGSKIESLDACFWSS